MKLRQDEIKDTHLNLIFSSGCLLYRRDHAILHVCLGLSYHNICLTHTFFKVSANGEEELLTVDCRRGQSLI